MTGRADGRGGEAPAVRCRGVARHDQGGNELPRRQCTNGAVACDECRRALAVFGDRPYCRGGATETLPGQVIGFYAITRHPEGLPPLPPLSAVERQAERVGAIIWRRDPNACRLCGAGEPEYCTFCLLEAAAAYRRQLNPGVTY